MKKIKKIVGDSVSAKKQKEYKYNLSALHKTIKNNQNENTQTLLLGGERTVFFVTEDSRKYISEIQQYKKNLKYDYVDSRGYFDSVHVRYVKMYYAGELQQKQTVSEFRNAKDIAISFRTALKLDLSPVRMWQVSLAGAVLFGMISMNMIYKNFGQNAMAKGGDVSSLNNNKSIELVVDETNKDINEVVKDDAGEIEIKEQNNKDNSVTVENKDKAKDEAVIKKVEKQKNDVQMDSTQKEDKKSVSDVKFVDSIQKKQSEQKDENLEIKKEYSLEREAYEMVEGYPIEKMLPYILKQDPEVAKYLIAMAKQESQWGKRVPVLNGQDCYNYWGYRSQRKLMGSGGHTCFNSREDAVETVGKRIHELIYEYDRKTADRLIVWKCGSSCDGHSQAGVDRWINVVGTYYDKLSKK